LPIFRQAKDTKRHLLPIFWVTEWTGDVKTVYFSEPVTGLPKPVFYRLPKGLLRAGYLSPVAPRLLSVDRLLLHGGRGPISVPDARTPQNKGQWRI